MKYNWVATTLNPYYEGNPLDFCVSDDRLVSYTLDKWCFGDDNTGSIFHEGMLISLKSLSFIVYNRLAKNLKKPRILNYFY